MSCEKACYEADVNGCGDITIRGGLAASAAYFAIISKDGSPNVYQRQITTQDDGSLVLTIANFPAGYFNGGYFTLKVRFAQDYTLQPLIFNSIYYNCLLFHIVNTDVDVDDTSPISVIQ